MSCILKPHPISKLFPPSSESEFKELCGDMKIHGQQEKGVLFEGMILDGNRRHAACIKLKMPFQWKEFRGTQDDAVRHSMSVNRHRRHLSEHQLACLGADMIKMFPRTNHVEYVKRGLRGRQLPIVAKMLNVSQRKVRDAIFLKTYKPELFEKCKNGEIGVGKAAKSIYSGLQDSPENKTPTCYSHDFEVSNFILKLTKDQGWKMYMEGIDGKFYCQIYGQNGIKSRVDFAEIHSETSMKRAAVCAIKEAMDSYNNIKIAI